MSAFNADLTRKQKKFRPLCRILSDLGSYSRLPPQVLLSALTRRAIISRQPVHIRQVGVLSSVKTPAVWLLFLCLFHRHSMPTSVVRPKFFFISVGYHPTSFIPPPATNPLFSLPNPLTLTTKKSNKITKLLHFRQKSSNFAAESYKDNKNEHKIMARPIKETPTLYGEDARRFAYAVEHPRKVTAAEMQRMEESYQMVKSITNFAF